MKEKKTPKANLENKKFIFFEIGLILSLLITFFAFEWKTDKELPDEYNSIEDIQVEEIVIPVTTPKVKLPPPPKVITNMIDIVSDDDLDVPDLDIEDADIDEDTEATVIPMDEPTEDYDYEATFNIVEHMPQFPGGEKALFKFLSRTVKYPVIAQENGIEGVVFVGFVIDKDGSIINVKVLRPVDPSLDKEAIRVIKAMPKWKPGRQRNKNVRVSYTVPIKFQLNN